MGTIFKAQSELLSDRAVDGDSDGEAYLVILATVDTGELGKRYLLTSEAFCVGRGAENALVIADDTVSWEHIRIERRDGGWVVVDLDSTNNLYVQGLQTREWVLDSGDVLRLGDTCLKYVAASNLEMLHDATADGLLSAARRDGVFGADPSVAGAQASDDLCWQPPPVAPARHLWPSPGSRIRN